jgi:hypothetical protein
MWFMIISVPNEPYRPDNIFLSDSLYASSALPLVGERPGKGNLKPDDFTRACGQGKLSSRHPRAAVVL